MTRCHRLLYTIIVLAQSLISPTIAQEWDVVVIGAGMSGVSAAYHLKSAGYKVLVLEARNRTGGRIWSQSVNNNKTVVDFGAAWIHGPTGNPLTQIVKSANVSTVATNLSDITMFYQGKQVSSAKIESTFAAFQQWDSFQAKLANISKVDAPLQAAVQTFISQGKLDAEQQDYLWFWINTQVELEWGAATSQLSLDNWNYGDAFAGDDVILPQGFHQLVDVVAKGLDMLLGKEVESVTYHLSGVTIVTKDGSTYGAQAAVVTLPLGVLKNGSVAFNPPLPGTKQKAIDTLGFGLLNRVVLVFPARFWDNVTVVTRVPVGKERGQFTYCLNYELYVKAPVLVCFVAADFAAELEVLKDAQIVALALEALRTTYVVVPNPAETYVTRWGQDPYSLGSYSFAAVNTSEADFKALGGAVNGTLYFAGEATSVKYPATVHGAYLSGKDAAASVGRYLLQKNSSGNATGSGNGTDTGSGNSTGNSTDTGSSSATTILQLWGRTPLLLLLLSLAVTVVLA